MLTREGGPPEKRGSAEKNGPNVEDVRATLSGKQSVPREMESKKKVESPRKNPPSGRGGWVRKRTPEKNKKSSA